MILKSPDVLIILSIFCNYCISSRNVLIVLRSILCTVTYVAIDFKIFYIVNRLLLLHRQQSEDRIFLYPINLRNEFKTGLKKILLCAVSFLVQWLFLDKNIIDELFLLLIIFLSIAFIEYFSFHDKNDIVEANELDIGYGAALNYYNNYLKYFLPYILDERIKTFKSIHKVHVKEKLFILVPKSCKIPRYLHSDERCQDVIERCRELPPLEINQGGIIKRRYNITVYLVKTYKNGTGVRMAVEYAQPLKQLFAFKEKKIITEVEMQHQRKLFFKHMQKFLRDSNDSYKFCELIDYDDEKKTVSEVLLESCGIDLLSETP